MKRLISIILAVVMLLSSTAVISIAAEGVATVSTSTVKGDVSGDLKVTAKDVLLIRRFLSGSLPSGTTFIKDNGDVTGDGKITSLDVLRIRQYLGGKIDSVDSTPSTDDGPVVSINGVSLSEYVITMPADLVASSDGTNPENTSTITNSFHYGVRKFRGYLSTVTKSCPNNIITEESAATGGYSHFIHCVESEDYGDEGFNICIDDSGDVWFSASAKRAGMLYAGFTFIEDYFGHRWLGNDAGEYQETGVVVDIKPGVNITEAPYFEYRASLGTAFTSAENGTMQRKLNTREQKAGVDTKQFGWGLGRGGFYNAHSLGPYTGGGELGENPCLTDNSTYNSVIAAMDNEIEKRVTNGSYSFGGDFTQISCSMNDGLRCCQCDACKAEYKKYGGFNGAYLKFVNRVAQYYQQLGPVCNYERDYLSIFCILYDRSLPVNKNDPSDIVIPEENVIVCYCGNGCNNHAFNSGECDSHHYGQVLDFVEENTDPEGAYWPANSKNPDKYITYFDGKNTSDVTNLTAYVNLAKSEREKNNGKSFKVYFWYYPTNYHYAVVSSPMLEVLREDINFLAHVGGIGVDGIYSEGQDSLHVKTVGDETEKCNDSYGFEKLKEYLIAELLWDPDMSAAEYELLMDHYLEATYGDAWTYIKEYAMMAEAATDEQDCWVNNTDAPWEMVSRSYYRNNYAKIVELFENALAAVSGDEKYVNRINEIRVLADFLGVSASYGSDQQNTDLVSRGYDRLYDYLKDGGGYDTAHEWSGYKLGLGNHTWTITYDKSVDPMKWYNDYANWTTPGAKRASNFK